MALHQIGRPQLPVPQELIETLQTLAFLMPPQQLDRDRGRTRPSIQHGNIYFPAREGLIKNRKITNHEGEQAETQAGLDDSNRSRGRTGRRDITKTESEESRAAVVKIREET